MPDKLRIIMKNKIKLSWPLILRAYDIFAISFIEKRKDQYWVAWAS
jgi:hypothetical protein